ncbi:MAG: hypothetical protein ACYDBW_01785 [Sulfuricaulis sp.]
MRHDKKKLVVAFILASCCPLPSFAAAKDGPPVSGHAGGGDAGMTQTIETESQQPMKMNQPMPSRMAKPGMKKGDVKARAMKKETIMDEMMGKEKMKQ